jgi:type VI secretion system protein ImpH
VRSQTERSLRHTEWLLGLQAEPWRFDFYQALRRIAAANPLLPPLGEALRPADEPLRIGQSASLDFAPAPLAAYLPGATPRLMQRVFGLLGPNGALPLHLTEVAHERALHHGDHALQRFLDMLTHRFALLFYRAWAEAQPVVAMDRGGDRRSGTRIGSLIGIGVSALQNRDALRDGSKLHFAGRLARQTRDADGLLAWLTSEFAAAVHIEQWCGHWMALDRDERTKLGRHQTTRLGRSAVLGASVWDVQHKFRITVGPLPILQYLRFLPGGEDLARLKAMVRHWVGLEFDWELRLILKRADVPRLQLHRAPMAALAREGAPGLGRTTWLGRYRGSGDAGELHIDVERARFNRRAPAAQNQPLQ